MKKIKSAKRGLTFVLDSLKIGQKFDYFIDLNTNEIIIQPCENGRNTVSRKKCGDTFKPLIDIRSKEVKELVQKSDYIKIEEDDNSIIVHCYKQVSEQEAAKEEDQSKVIRIGDVFGVETGVIRLTVEQDFPMEISSSTRKYLDEQYTSIGKKILFGRKNRKEVDKVYNVASLFSGAGLLDHAFKDPKIRFVYGVDFDRNACETYAKNIGNHIHCKDIREVEAKEIPDVDIIIGGPCCQAYSNANRTNINTEEGEDKRLLIDDYIRLTLAKRPYVFVIENVPQLLTKSEGKYIKRVLNELGNDYEITCAVVDDSKVGGYTKRKRAIVIGSRVGKIELDLSKPIEVKTVRDALSKVDASWYNYEDVTKPKPETVLKMSYVPQGGNWKDIPEEIHKFGPSTQSNTYRRLAWNEVSPTIINWRKSLMMHPEENRILTVAEAAALMGLDKDFPIYGNTLDSKQQQVGNGVTQAIGRFVKKAILKVLDAFCLQTAYSY